MFLHLRFFCDFFVIFQLHNKNISPQKESYLLFHLCQSAHWLCSEEIAEMCSLKSEDASTQKNISDKTLYFLCACIKYYCPLIVDSCCLLIIKPATNVLVLQKALLGKYLCAHYVSLMCVLSIEFWKKAKNILFSLI